MTNHSSCILWKDCKIVNNIICLSTTLLVIRVVVGGWKSLVFTIQVRIPQECGLVVAHRLNASSKS